MRRTLKGSKRPPTLNDDELLKLLVDFEVPEKTAQAALQCVPKAVQKAFEALLNSIFDVTADDLIPKITIPCDVGGTHDYFFAMVEIVQALKDRLSRLGCPDFNLRDVSVPEPQRVRKQFSAIVRFGLHRANMAQKRAAMAEEIQRAKDRNAHLAAEAADTAAMLELAQREKAERDEVVAVEEEKLRVQKEQEEAVRVEWQASKEALEGVQAKRSKLLREMKQRELYQEQLAHDLASAKGQLVTDPKGLERALEDAEAELERQRALHAAAAASVPPVEHRRKEVAKLTRDVQELTAFINTKLKPELDGMAAAEGKVAALKAELEDLDAERVRIQAQAKAAMNDLSEQRVAAKQAAGSHEAAVFAAEAEVAAARLVVNKAIAQAEIDDAEADRCLARSKEAAELREEARAWAKEQAVRCEQLRAHVAAHAAAATDACAAAAAVAVKVS